MRIRNIDSNGKRLSFMTVLVSVFRVEELDCATEENELRTGTWRDWFYFGFRSPANRRACARKSLRSVWG